MSAAHPLFTITIAPDRDGKAALWVSLPDADGAPMGPPQRVVLNNKLAAFVDSAQAFARRKLASLESTPQGRAEDGDPTIAGEAAHGEQVR